MYVIFPLKQSELMLEHKTLLELETHHDGVLSVRILFPIAGQQCQVVLGRYFLPRFALLPHRVVALLDVPVENP